MHGPVSWGAPSGSPGCRCGSSDRRCYGWPTAHWTRRGTSCRRDSPAWSPRPLLEKRALRKARLRARLRWAHTGRTSTTNSSPPQYPSSSFRINPPILAADLRFFFRERWIPEGFTRKPRKPCLDASHHGGLQLESKEIHSETTRFDQDGTQFRHRVPEDGHVVHIADVMTASRIDSTFPSLKRRARRRFRISCGTESKYFRTSRWNGRGAVRHPSPFPERRFADYSFLWVEDPEMAVMADR